MEWDVGGMFIEFRDFCYYLFQLFLILQLRSLYFCPSEDFYLIPQLIDLHLTKNLFKLYIILFFSFVRGCSFMK